MTYFLKPTSLALSVSFFLGGCQLTALEQGSEQHTPVAMQTVSSDNIALPMDISEALSADETANVYHPVADVDITLTDEPVVNVADDIWQRIRNELTFNIPQNSRVISQRNWYARNPAYMDRVAKRAEPFIFYILEELKNHQMPIELALLPIVESAYDPFAYSHGRASGMWQFVPETGKRFGMKQNWWYDGRRDIVASTQGAIDYLSYLHKKFDGDWLLALASYNSGEGRVMRAMRNNARKGKPTDFWSLDLPKETRAYVPKLLALVDLVKRPQDFNLNLYALENRALLTKVNINSQIDLALAAELSALTLAELQRLNPGFNRWATAPDGPNYLLLPSNKAEDFKAKLAKIKPEDIINSIQLPHLSAR
jgi:membrane-bound lytic murein transglycosylase D